MDRFPYAPLTEFDRAFLASGADILKHTLPIFRKVDDNYILEGSAVLAFIENHCVLVTAGHVLTHFSSLAVNANGKMWFLIYHFLYFIKEQPNDMDVGMVVLDEDLALMLVNEIIPVTSANIVLDHVPEEIIRYLVVGFPEKLSKSSKENKIVKISPAKMLLEACNEKIYSYYKLKREAHVALLYAGSGNSLLTGKRISTLDEPYGMSGCGIWLMSAKKVNNDIQAYYSLIGIITDIKKGKYHCIFGYGIKFLINHLQKFLETK
ncbi:hypothetical protein BH10BAC2_BH10BAC2_02390 [soil metagenome]